MQRARVFPWGMPAVEELLSQLNPPQREAVTFGDGPLLIIAGAGSGKTRVLTYRIAYLLWRGVRAEHVLALTFTNKAAEEMRERLFGLVEPERARQLWMGTFHSIFARILRLEAPRLGYTPDYTIYDTEDSTGLLRTLLRQMGIGNHVLDPAAARHQISHLKNRMCSWQEFAASARTPRERLLAELYRAYEEQLRANNAMDFDDLLFNTIRLFQAHPDVLARYQERFRYIFVDEYQDTNRAQYVALQLLAARYRNLCVVGDDAQSIYRWRGADIRNILDFQRDYPDATLIRLEQNYRSTQRILAAADALIRHNQQQIPKRLWTANPEGELIRLLICADERDEAAQVLHYIQRELDSGTPAGAIAVLYRTNAQSQPLEEALRRARIPYVLVGGISFYQRKEIKDALAYLRLLLNPADMVSWLRVINEPPRGIGAATLEQLRQAMHQHNLSFLEVLEHADTLLTGIRRSARENLQALAALIRRYREALHSSAVPLDLLVLEYLEATGLLALYRQDEQEQERYMNLERLIATLSEYVQSSPAPSLREYLQQVALMSESELVPDSADAVTLMTLHAAKGLEFSVVFITGLEQGLLPLARATESREELEEERRLLYVGMTRARERLYLSYAQHRWRWGESILCRPSDFLQELPPELLEPIPSPTAAPGVPFQSALCASATEGMEEDGLYPGARVRHPVFGVGTVEALSGSGENRRAVVRFPHVGRKLLLLRYARLQLLHR